MSMFSSARRAFSNRKYSSRLASNWILNTDLKSESFATKAPIHRLLASKYAAVSRLIKKFSAQKPSSLKDVRRLAKSIFNFPVLKLNPTHISTFSAKFDENVLTDLQKSYYRGTGIITFRGNQIMFKGHPRDLDPSIASHLLCLPSTNTFAIDHPANKAYLLSSMEYLEYISEVRLYHQTDIFARCISEDLFIRTDLSQDEMICKNVMNRTYEIFGLLQKHNQAYAASFSSASSNYWQQISTCFSRNQLSNFEPAKALKMFNLVKYCLNQYAKIITDTFTYLYSEHYSTMDGTIMISSNGIIYGMTSPHPDSFAIPFAHHPKLVTEIQKTNTIHYGDGKYVFLKPNRSAEIVKLFEPSLYLPSPRADFIFQWDHLRKDKMRLGACSDSWPHVPNESTLVYSDVCPRLHGKHLSRYRLARTLTSSTLSFEARRIRVRQLCSMDDNEFNAHWFNYNEAKKDLKAVNRNVKRHRAELLKTPIILHSKKLKQKRAAALMNTYTHRMETVFDFPRQEKLIERVSKTGKRIPLVSTIKAKSVLYEQTKRDLITRELASSNIPKDEYREAFISALKACTKDLVFIRYAFALLKDPCVDFAKLMCEPICQDIEFYLETRLERCYLNRQKEICGSDQTLNEYFDFLRSNDFPIPIKILLASRVEKQLKDGINVADNIRISDQDRKFAKYLHHLNSGAVFGAKEVNALNRTIHYADACTGINTLMKTRHRKPLHSLLSTIKKSNRKSSQKRSLYKIFCFLTPELAELICNEQMNSLKEGFSNVLEKYLLSAYARLDSIHLAADAHYFSTCLSSITNERKIYNALQHLAFLMKSTSEGVRELSKFMTIRPYTKDWNTKYVQISKHVLAAQKYAVSQYKIHQDKARFEADLKKLNLVRNEAYEIR